MKEPFSLEQATSLRYSTFLERGLANALAPSRNTGVLATSTHFDKRLRLAAGVFFLDESLASNLRLSANYVHGRVFGQGDVDILKARLQVDF